MASNSSASESLPLLNPLIAPASDDGPAHRHGVPMSNYDDTWEIAPEGTVARLLPTNHQIKSAEHERHVANLGEFRATSIAGNDITSSCFYTLGLCSATAGVFAPISLLMVSVVLFLFRSIYSEVGTALPLNGGAYNCLLNATSKFVASLAACLTILSYTATAVVSADTAMVYAHNIWDGLPIKWTTIGLLGVFCLLTLMGLSESANVALTLFVGHLAVMSILIVFGTCSVFQNLEFVHQNIAANWHFGSGQYSIPLGIYFGFAKALLGVSGFESSSNYIEEQLPGVFPKTLRNMWAITAVLNSWLSILLLLLLPLDPKAGALSIITNQTNALAILGQQAGGPWLKLLVSIDAAVVLSGAVLTAYVGVSGLIKRMSMDRCLPQFFLSVNPWRQTNHWILIGFFVLTSSLLIAANGSINTLSSVYTIAFLSVMALFALGNALLKYKRGKLPRAIYASWFSVLAGFTGVVAGLVGNIVFHVQDVEPFVVYFLITVAVVMVMFARIRLLKVLLFFMKRATWCASRFAPWIQNQVRKIKKQKVVFFTKTDELSVLNKAVLYMAENELSSCMMFVCVYKQEADIPAQLERNVKVLDSMYPKTRFDLVLVKCDEGFSPEIVDWLSSELHISKNFMFITCPGNRFPHNVSSFGGVRVITH